MQDVKEFAEEKGMADKTELIQKGALIAQDASNFENISILSEEEKEVLRYEADHRWKHPLRLYVTIIVCSVGAAVQGWDQTGYVNRTYRLNGLNMGSSNSIQVQRSQSELSS